MTSCDSIKHPLSTAFSYYRFRITIPNSFPEYEFVWLFYFSVAGEGDKKKNEKNGSQHISTHNLTFWFLTNAWNSCPIGKKNRPFLCVKWNNLLFGACQTFMNSHEIFSGERIPTHWDRSSAFGSFGSFGSCGSFYHNYRSRAVVLVVLCTLP